MATYKSFLDISKAWGKRKPKETAQKALHEVGVFVRDWVRSEHGGSRLKKESALTLARKGGSSPLVDTGALKQAVSFRATSGAVIVFSQKPYLRDIHEFGVKYKMSDKQRKFIMAMLAEYGLLGKKQGRPRTSSKGYIVVPPRPIWRLAITKTQGMIRMILRKHIKQDLTN